MAHFKRRKPRTHVRCVMCTSGRCGNSAAPGGMTRRHLKRLPRRGQDGQGRRGWRAEQAQ